MSIEAPEYKKGECVELNETTQAFIENLKEKLANKTAECERLKSGMNKITVTVTKLIGDDMVVENRETSLPDLVDLYERLTDRYARKVTHCRYIEDELRTRQNMIQQSDKIDPHKIELLEDGLVEKQKAIEDLLEDVKQWRIIAKKNEDEAFELRQRAVNAEDERDQLEVKYDHLFSELEKAREEIEIARAESKPLSANDVIKITLANDPAMLMRLKEEGII